MLDGIDTKEGLRHLGVDAKLVAKTNAPKSGRRMLVQERDPLTEVKSGMIKGTKYSEQDFRSDASSSLWKEYLLDKKHVTGVLLDNNMLVWFFWDKDLSGTVPAELAREKYPDCKVNASFVFGEKALGMSTADLAIRSNLEVFDSQISSLVDYFGRSLDWQEGVSVSILYQDKQREVFQGSMQEYLVSH